MKPIRIVPAVAALSVGLLLGCTWVPLTEAGKGVRTLTPDAVSGCEKLRNVNAQTADRVWMFARTERKMNEELEALAKNDAAEVGGNAIVPTGPRSDGRRSFAVYRCPGR